MGKFRLDGTQDAGQHWSYVDVGSFRPIQQRDEPFARQWTQDIFHFIPFPPCGAGHGRNGRSCGAGKTTPGPQLFGSIVDVECIEYSLKGLASSLGIPIEASHDELGAGGGHT